MTTTKKPKKVQTKYQKGAQFERDMLVHLRGDPKKYTTGWIQKSIAEIFKDIWTFDKINELLKIGAWRTPGSKGEGHVDVICLISLGSLQVCIGVQCKTSIYPSKADIDKDMKAMADVGLIPSYAIKDKSGFKWVHSPYDALYKRLRRTKNA